jgi:DNA-binding MarR family transcriptional regulator
MSNRQKSYVAERISTAIMRWQDATQSFDELVGKHYGLIGAERRCLAFLTRGPAAASEIAKEISLTPAAVTSLLDRLEERGFVRRSRSTEDRRKVLVHATEKTHSLARDVYGPIAKEGAALMVKFTTSELETVAMFIEDALTLQLKFSEKLLRRES